MNLNWMSKHFSKIVNSFLTVFYIKLHFRVAKIISSLATEVIIKFSGCNFIKFTVASKIYTSFSYLRMNYSNENGRANDSYFVHGTNKTEYFYNV